ncbi:hypothetical protein Ssi02_16800 [Sinosporangium siamense]|uniref:Uncharacterized protein n=1 Tax=Sinosporangium siamense TaxID=1367973 RepID=A0A919RGL8_9ACTN|nr:hypothetical protein Ssi02_16800 [Sinosporangium siamense]
MGGNKAHRFSLWSRQLNRLAKPVHTGGNPEGTTCSLRRSCFKARLTPPAGSGHFLPIATSTVGGTKSGGAADEIPAQAVSTTPNAFPPQPPAGDPPRTDEERVMRGTPTYV